MGFGRVPKPFHDRLGEENRNELLLAPDLGFSVDGEESGHASCAVDRVNAPRYRTCGVAHLPGHDRARSQSLFELRLLAKQRRRGLILDQRVLATDRNQKRFGALGRDLLEHPDFVQHDRIGNDDAVHGLGQRRLKRLDLRLFNQLGKLTWLAPLEGLKNEWLEKYEVE